MTTDELVTLCECRVKDLEDREKTIGRMQHMPFVIMRETDAASLRLARRAFPSSDFVTWTEYRNYEKYADPKYRKHGILYAEDYCELRGIAPETVMAHSPIGPQTELWIRDLDSSCIVMDCVSQIKEVIGKIGETGGDHLFLEKTPHIKDAGCLTRDEFVARVALKKINTSLGTVSCGKFLKNGNMPTVILESPGRTLKEASRIIKGECVEHTDAGELAVAYAIKFGRAMPARSVSRDGEIVSGKLGDYNYDDDGIREGGELLKINWDEEENESTKDFEEYVNVKLVRCAGGISISEWNLIESSVMAVAFEEGGDFCCPGSYVPVVEPEHEGHSEASIINCDGLLCITRGNANTTYAESTLGEMYRYIIGAIKAYEYNLTIERYSYAYGPIKDMEDGYPADGCGGYHTINEAIDAAYHSGFGK